MELAHKEAPNMKSKNIRLEKIPYFIRDHEVGTQKRSSNILKEEGISATQATVSRDIKRIGHRKTPLKGTRTMSMNCHVSTTKGSLAG